MLTDLPPREGRRFGAAEIVPSAMTAHLIRAERDRTVTDPQGSLGSVVMSAR